MKRLILAALSLAVLSSSCKKELEQVPLSTQTTENFFSTAADFQQALNGVYSVALKGSGSPIGNNYGYPDRLMNLSETRSDNLYAITTANRDWEGINGFHPTIAGNSYVNEAWINNYNAISKANTILEQLALRGNVITDDSTRVQIEAQTRFLRAFCYFDLVRWFGKVPLVTRNVTPNEALSIPRTAVTAVYDTIIADMSFAANRLPRTYDAVNVGRATRFAAKGLLALIHMTRSSSTYNIEGAQLGLSEWGTAYSLLQEIVGSGLYSLHNRYDSVFRLEGSANKESVFDVQYLFESASGSGASGNFPSHLTPDNYFQSIGITAQGSNEERPVSSDFRASFAANDKRRQFGILDSFTWNNVKSTYPFYVKFVDKARYITRYNWGVDFPVLRYTDVLMMRAECTLHGGGGSQSDVDAIMTSVRRRAGDSAAVSGTNLEQLFAERRKEFFAEGKRWFDMQRSGKILELFQAWDAAVDGQNRVNPFSYDFILYPVPTSQMQVKPGLYSQNQGYN